MDPGVALSEFREEIGLKDFSPSEVAFIFEQLQLPKRNIVAVNDVEIKPAPSESMMRADAPGTDSGLHKRVETPDTKSASISGDESLSASSSSATILGDMPVHQDLSQEEGFTADLFGLEMPTETAKKLGSSIGLPDHHIHRLIRPCTPHRTTFRPSPFLTETTMEPPKKQEKRKASPALQQGRRISPLKNDLKKETPKEAVVESALEENVPGQKHGGIVHDWLRGVPYNQEPHTPMKDLISTTLEKLQIRYHIRIDRADFSRFMNNQASNQEAGFKGTYRDVANPSSSLDTRAYSLLPPELRPSCHFVFLNCRTRPEPDLCMRNVAPLNAHPVMDTDFECRDSSHNH